MSKTKCSGPFPGSVQTVSDMDMEQSQLGALTAELDVVRTLREEIELRERTEQALFAELGALRAENRLDKENVKRLDEVRAHRGFYHWAESLLLERAQRIRVLQSRLFEKAEGATQVRRRCHPSCHRHGRQLWAFAERRARSPGVLRARDHPRLLRSAISPQQYQAQ